MKKWVLPVRAVDRAVFDAIKDGSKKIETRAFSKTYEKIRMGDILVFSCGGARLEKKVSDRRLFPSVEDMYKEIDYKKVMPWASSLEEAIRINKSFPNYKERLKEGIIAWELG